MRDAQASITVTPMDPLTAPAQAADPNADTADATSAAKHVTVAVADRLRAWAPQARAVAADNRVRAAAGAAVALLIVAIKVRRGRDNRRIDKRVAAYLKKMR
ncbi:hypothetical protein Lfu02_68080 [Longispora fulva]|uniref:Uncharacterized protein n=1 Tax=Longispora fulva TaxID=619741 RepID=A0A8J7GE51_9ACTN|nr:hypothetical protein [Longispora fulva]MBG6134063.1 hypothetical protein [Longispora fulva]GIG62436.1 hypothetical protein Lfu02_68080 [Longispora fulva]